jgi:Ca2+-binding EF-hand superfamily protein
MVKMKRTVLLSFAFALHFSVAPCLAQSAPNPNNNGQNPQLNQRIAVTLNQKPKSPPDEFKSFLNALEEAYKAPREVDADVLDELRKQYRGPTPEREAKIFREIRRLYSVTVDRQEAIAEELRRAYELQTREQEDRLFTAIRRGGKLPLGTVAPEAQTELSAKLFGRLDQDGNGTLSNEEIPEGLRNQQGKWDRNLDGMISLDEYRPYYQASLKVVAERVASGEIYLRAAQQVPPNKDDTPAPKSAPSQTEDGRPMIARFGKLPEGLPKWFAELDRDGDGQVGLYEWVKAGKPVDEFQAMDRNGDGLLEAAELLRYLADIARKTGGTVQK